ncbi:MAG TPA: leucine-rich repeat domain-containing protein, partial [Phycisphaerales bacterium]|nr:leucine-rich repeat domain-containing protein [Phycisphaerales bacterium]
MGSLELQRKLDGISTGESVSLRIEPSEVSDFFSALESRDTALSKVKNLELGGCDLRTLPESFGNLTALRVLSLARNRLTSLPDSIGNLTDLKSLYLYNNELTALPNSFFNLRCLEELFLHFNRLTALPATFGQLTALRYLDAHLNQLHDLPQSFNELRALTHLNISRNEFRSLPRTACRLPSLAELFVAGNQLETLPEGVGTLGSLEVLSIARNHVDSLPDSIGHLSKLTTFFASDNRLSALPASMEQMRSLRSLFLHENPALELPPEVLGPPWIECKGHGGTAEPAKPQEILSFYFARSAAAARGELAPIHEVKVMLVGRGGAGKTSLRRFFLGQRHDPKEAETPGIALDTLERTCGGKRIKLHLWDFAGQEITHALHQFFLTGGSVYVLVLDPRSNTEMADAFYWLDQLSRFAPGAPVVVALNRQDSRIGGYDVDRNQLLERYPQIRSFVPTNCESRAGCEDLLQAITQVIEAQPKDELPWLDVPREWLSVKDTCWRMGNRDGGPTAKNAGSGVKHKLKFSEFQTLCADNKITEKERQESLARILHRLGAVLHFVDDPRLRDTSVLDPHWVTDGV